MTESSSQPPGRGPLLPVMLPWLVFAAVDFAIVRTAFVQPEPWQYLLEAALAAGMGWAQWTFGRSWGRSSLLAAVIAAIFGVLPHAPEGAARATPFIAGIVLPAILAVRWLEQRWRTPAIAGAALAALVVAGVHWIDRQAQATVTTDPGTSAPAAVEHGAATVDAAAPIVVLSIDTLRADSAESMPTLQALSQRGAYWPRAMSTSSWTLPALASLQTGLMPSVHGAGCLEDSHCQGLSSSVETLAEQLAESGWRTAAIIANPWAGAHLGFDRGFDEFVDSGQPGKRLLIGGQPVGRHGQDDARTIDEAIAWLENDAPEGGFYLWVHLLGPHMPYTHSSSEKLRTLDPVTLRSSYPSSPAQKKEIRDSYDAEVRYTDEQVARFVAALDARGILAKGTFVVTADHGEEFWDHGGVEHGHSHHGEVTDVPLILVAAGVEPGRKSGVASILDVAPTIRRIAGLDSDGLDLRTDIPADRVVEAWGGIILRLDCSARDASRRIISRDCARSTSAMRVYDLEHDPGEQLPLPAAEDSPLVRAIRAIEAPAKSDSVSLGSDRLRALGYLQ